MSTQLLMTPEQAAQMLGISRTAIYQLLGDGSLDSVKIGRSRRIPMQSLERFVQSLQSEASDGG